MKQQFRFRRTTIIMMGLASFLAGLAMGHRFLHYSFIWILLGAVLLVAGIGRTQWLLLIGCMVLGISLGWWRGAEFRKSLLPYENLYGKKLKVELTAKTDGTYADSGNLGFDAGDVKILEPQNLELPGTLKIEGRGMTAVYRSDKIVAEGKLYPAGGARQGSIKFASLSLERRHLNWLEKVRLKFNAGMQNALPEPMASFGLGILIGQRSTLPQEVTDALAIVGLTHIIAVSGYNLTIIVDFLGKRVGRSKYQKTLFSCIVVGLFVLFTGFSASIVRAAIVSVLGIGAWYHGRKFRPLLILLLSGAITAGWYPVYIWSDIGWYLSFLAFFGVLVLAPQLMELIWKKQPRGLWPVMLESACAQIMTAPLIMYIFKTTSLVALPSNMLIVPLVPFAMFFSLVAGIAGMTMSGFSAWLALPARLLLSAMLQIVSAIATVPHALVQHQLPLGLVIGLYGFLSLSVWLIWMKVKPKYGTITPKQAEAAAVQAK